MNAKNEQILSIVGVALSGFTLLSVLLVITQLREVKPPQIVEKVVVVTPAPTATPSATLKPVIVKPTVKAIVK